jgi:hypothetical protein
MNVYARARPGLFVVFAPAVLGCIAMLALPSIAGLIVGVGALGLLGLIGLFLAWVSLASNRRPGATSVIFLAAGVCAAVLGVAMATVTRGYDPFVTGMLGGIGASYGVLAVWFICALLGKTEAPGTMTPEAIVFAVVVAIATAIVPLTALVKSRSMSRTFWSTVGEEGETKATVARDAVEAFAATHDGRLPDDNAEAGLPEPTAMHGRYVYAVTVEAGAITVAYGNEPISTLFGIDNGQARLVVTPGHPSSSGGRNAWSCAMSGIGRYGSPTFTGLCRGRS